VRNPDARDAVVGNQDKEAIGKSVFIKQEILDEMIDYCRKQLPYEACGILSGKERHNETLWKMINTERSTTSFAMDMEELGLKMKLIRKRNERMTGIFHSHPTAPALPSRGDIKNAHYPDTAYFIISFFREIPDVRCYSIRNFKVNQLKLIILN
jgi:[CysO sulfur-carrier protein]-S-L-cysteine hydrolase